MTGSPQAIGIDFGTSTTVAAAVYPMQAAESWHLLADERGTVVMPSVVAFAPSGTVFVGEKARARRLIDPQNTLSSIKRVMGRSWFSPEIADFRRRYPFDLQRTADGGVAFQTRLGLLTAMEVGAYVFARLREFQPLASAPTNRAVVTVPASFRDIQRQAVLAAAARAGFSHAEVIEEPLSAVMAYAGQQDLGDTVAVYDLGGGTFDVAVLRRHGDGYDVLASGGDDYLGGDDIDQQCARWASEEILKRHGWDVRTSTSAFLALVHACERAKIRLGEVDETSIPLGQVESTLQGEDLRLERALFSSLNSNLVRRTFVACDEVLSRAGVAPHRVDSVLLAGGSCYSPAVQAGVGAYFGKTPISRLPLDQIVAIGAARFAHRGASLWHAKAS